MKATLTRFRVQNFRSIEDSGWIAAEDISCLVGTNESGKTNLLLALWKLNPANNEPIDPLVDYPRKKYSEYDGTEGKEVFITAEFELKDETLKKLLDVTAMKAEEARLIEVSRQFNGQRNYTAGGNEIKRIKGNGTALKNCLTEINSAWIKYKDWETAYENHYEANAASKRKEINELIESEINRANPSHDYTEAEIKEIIARIDAFKQDQIYEIGAVSNFFNEKILSDLNSFKEQHSAPSPDTLEQLLIKLLPTFVYYSDYGNLDSEIYMPHVLENFERKDLGTKERAKARSLKVLFDFVDLQPLHILELGKEGMPVKVIEKVQRSLHGNTETKEHIQHPDKVDIEEERKQKKKREILLQSASVRLTERFREWWKQGAYAFRFQADGNHFRIWVTDDKRSEPIELESRSKGLQWFFSFFLVFLVESKDSHANCILLLDEPGLSLHPMAQMDLINFFDSLAQENQLIYTTHSPFLVSTNHLSGVHAMYVDVKGKSVVSSDLRANKPIAEKSIYPIHAAIGLTVSDTLLLGCQPVLVEGVSDQIYLQLIKKYVLSQGKYKNDKEIVFIPTGGVKAIASTAKLLMGRDDSLPYTLLDSDKPGLDMLKHLKSGLYAQEHEKLIALSDIIGEGAFEIEDLMPGEELAKRFAKQYRSVHTEEDFDDLYEPGKPIVDQMEAFAKDNGHSLPLGWKVELAKEVNRNFDRVVSKADEKVTQQWLDLMQRITS